MFSDIYRKLILLEKTIADNTLNFQLLGAENLNRKLNIN